MVDDFEEREDAADSRGSLLPESLRKALVTGLSAVFMTEEGIRGALSELRLPKEAATYLLQQTAAGKREFARILGDELRGLVKNADLSATLRKAFAGLKLEIRADIRIVDETAERERRAGETNEPNDPDESGPGPRRRSPK